MTLSPEFLVGPLSIYYVSCQTVRDLTSYHLNGRYPAPPTAIIRVDYNGLPVNKIWNIANIDTKTH